jgi:hypothetical protein
MAYDSGIQLQPWLHHHLNTILGIEQTKRVLADSEFMHSNKENSYCVRNVHA